HRRHRLDPRRLHRGAVRRPGRHRRPRLPARPAAHPVEPQGGVHGGAGAVVDADLSVDGERAGGPSGGAVSGRARMSRLAHPRVVAVALVLAALALLPAVSAATGNGFLLVISTRIVIMAIAAVSLNLILGYGGMVSFGHAAYLGIGGYAVGILAHAGIYSGWVQWPVAILASGAFALLVGMLCLRTRGVYFIMVTLAFAQMAYYVATGLDEYGGD